jgi:hypothetical protein
LLNDGAASGRGVFKGPHLRSTIPRSIQRGNIHQFDGTRNNYPISKIPRQYSINRQRRTPFLSVVHEGFFKRSSRVIDSILDSLEGLSN